MATKSTDTAKEWVGLKADSFGWAGQFFQSMAHIAPAIGIMMTAPYMASRAGSALPLATLFGMVLAMLLAYCLGLLTRKYHGASGYFQIHSRALGSKVGFITSWLFLIYEPFNVFAVWLGFGAIILEPFSQSYLGYQIPWWVGVLGGNIVVTGLSLAKIKGSMRVTALLSIAEFVIFSVFAVLLLVKSGEKFQPHYFTLASSAEGYGGLSFAFIFGFLAFVGYESGLPLTEETKNAKKSTFKGLMLSVFIAGVFFTFVSYATVIGFGGGGNSVQFAKDFSNAQNPYGSSMAIKAFGAIGPWLIFFAALNSTLGSSLASQNASARVLFALGRSGILWYRLGKTTRRTQVPASAVYFSSAVTLLMTILFYFIVHGNGMDWYGFFGVAMVLPLLIIHLMTCVSVYVAYRYREKGGFNFFQHLLLPLITGLLVLLPIWGSVYYNLTPPISYAPFVVVIWFIVGIATYAWLRSGKPQSLRALEQEMSVLAKD